MTLMTDTLKLVARDNDTMGSLGCMESTGSGFSSAVRLASPLTSLSRPPLAARQRREAETKPWTTS